MAKVKATWLTRVLKRQTNCGKVAIKWKPVNRGGDFGLEVPCEHIFEGDDLSCEWPHRKDGSEIWYRGLSCYIKQQPNTAQNSDCQLHKYSTVFSSENYDESEKQGGTAVLLQLQWPLDCLKARALWCHLPQAFVGRRRWNVFSTDSICIRGCYLTGWRIKLVLMR